jgi:hypothetical protein
MRRARTRRSNRRGLSSRLRPPDRQVSDGRCQYDATTLRRLTAPLDLTSTGRGRSVRATSLKYVEAFWGIVMPLAWVQSGSARLRGPLKQGGP